MSSLEKFFKLKENNTNVKTEVLAGITTFMTMAYILVVNPDILSSAGMDKGGVFTATALSAVVATLVMAFYANYPFVLAPGMGLNAFFAYTVVLQQGYSWQMALAAVFIEGLIFIVLTFTNVREAIVNAIPLNLKYAVSGGIGLFIAFIGLEKSGIIIQGEGTPLSLGNLTSKPAIVAIIGILITGILVKKGIKGAILIGIALSTILSLALGITKFNGIMSVPPSLSKVAFKMDFSKLFSFDMIIILFTFLFVDMFDTVGTLVGVSAKANMLDSEGKLPRAKQALFADAVGTTFGAAVGTSTVTTFVESASGVAEGGRTGLTALVSAGLFGLSLLFAPLFLIIPGAATAPALVVVGVFMMGSVVKIDFEDITEGLPAFLAIIMMPLAYSIAEGIVFGIVSFVVLKLATGKKKEVSGIMIFLALLFIVKEVLPVVIKMVK